MKEGSVPKSIVFDSLIFPYMAHVLIEILTLDFNGTVNCYKS